MVRSQTLIATARRTARPAALMLALAAGASTQPLVIGEVEIPLGDDAFPVLMQCTFGGVCGGDEYVYYAGDGATVVASDAGLLGLALLDVVISDLTLEDDLRLSFPGTIVNEPGPDIYLAQAHYLSGPLAQDDIVRDTGLRFCNAPEGVVVPKEAFTLDALFGTHTTWIAPTGGAPEASVYELWYTLVDLSDYGYLEGEFVPRIHVWTPDTPAEPLTAGLDVVAVLKLNGAAWANLGGALAGTLGAPALVGEGALVAGTPVTLTIEGALGNAPATFAIGTSELGVPFKGGTMVPDPMLWIAGLSVAPDGTLAIGTTWPAGVPAGTEIYVQAWIVDAGGPKGFAATNGLVGTASDDVPADGGCG